MRSEGSITPGASLTELAGDSILGELQDERLTGVVLEVDIVVIRFGLENWVCVLCLVAYRRVQVDSCYLWVGESR